jgi:hypothetical protein
MMGSKTSHQKRSPILPTANWKLVTRGEAAWGLVLVISRSERALGFRVWSLGFVLRVGICDFPRLAGYLQSGINNLEWPL